MADRQSAAADGDFAPYVTGRCLGTGSFGKVYLAHHSTRPASTVALKAHAGSLPAEAEFLLSLNHPNINRFLEFPLLPAGQCIVLEYAVGGSLEGLLRERNGPLASTEAARVLLQVVEALEYVHLKGIGHLAVKWVPRMRSSVCLALVHLNLCALQTFECLAFKSCPRCVIHRYCAPG